MGSYPSATIGVSIEGGTFYFWINGGANSFGSVTVSNVWKHFAITRSGTSVRVFENGVQLGSTLTSTYNFNDTTNVFTIGNEASKSTDAAYGGLITNFHVVKGTALYMAKFCIPQTPRAAVANSKLLLNSTTSGTLNTDSSGTSKTITNVGVTFSATPPS